MNIVLTELASVGGAALNHDNGVFEIILPEWSGFLNRPAALRAVAELRQFCDAAESALTQPDQQPTGPVLDKSGDAERFIKECCELDMSYQVNTRTLYQAYGDWCNKNSFQRKNSNLFASKVSGMAFTRYSNRNGVFWAGLRLTQTDQDAQS